MILGVTGRIGSGKDTIADYLCTFHGFKRLSFAASLKDAVANIFNWNREYLEGATESSRLWREQKDEWWSKRLGMDITPRFILQYWGTEVCRNNFHQDIWIASLENKLLKLNDNIVITDCRFENELKVIKEAGGITCRVERGSRPDWYDDAIALNRSSEHTVCTMLKNRLQQLNIHASEYSSVGLEYDHYLDNNKTVTELHEQIESILRQATS